jgi:ribonucleotide reductase alpha subunit
MQMPFDETNKVLDRVQLPGRNTVLIDRSRDALLTDFGKDTLTDRYLLEGEDYQDLFARVASAYGDDQAHAQRLYDYMSRLWFMPATPVLSNGGTTRGLPISCYLNECDDSLEGIVNLWNENVWLAAPGGGIGSYWGNLRSIGESVGGVGKTSGIVPFVKVMDSLTLAISQGSLRRGSAAVYLDVCHPEIEEFVDIRRATGGDPNRKAQNLHHGILVSDAFMRAVEADEIWPLVSPKDQTVIRSVSARSLWIRILTARIETGEPYLVFSDRVAELQPQHHKLAGLKVKTSNLCVAPETMVLTNKGHFPIKELAGQTVKVWNGQRWSEAPVEKTGEWQPLIRVLFSDGSHIDCTRYHRFYTQNDYHSSPVEFRAGDLKPGDKLAKFEMPLTAGGESWDNPYANGFFSADGTYDRNSRPFTQLYDAKRNLAQHLMLPAAHISAGPASTATQFSTNVKACGRNTQRPKAATCRLRSSG